MHLNTFSYDEAEAAMCLWEECLGRLDHCRHNGGVSAMEECEMWNWLRGGEGMANARGMCLELARDVEYSWVIAHDHFGFDDSFDWEFVPRWVNYAMELTETHLITPQWCRYLAYKVTEDWRTIFDG
jgi:hypothetical protein